MKFLALAFLLAFSTAAYKAHCQEEDLLQGLHNDSVQKEYVYNAFKSTRVIMSHSIEMLPTGVLDFRILHRFGKVNGGISEFFGLDGPANVRLGLDYALADHLTIGVGRSTFNKELDGVVKYRLIHQSKGPDSAPFSLVSVLGSTLRTARWFDGVNHTFSDRLNYYTQVIIGRKFNDVFTLQLAPILLHRNYVEKQADDNELWAASAGGIIKLSRRVFLTFYYYYVFNPDENKGLKNPLSIGFDIETGGHVFQLHFTNAHGMNERAFLTETINSWGQADVEFGFNISRTFQVRKRRL